MVEEVEDRLLPSGDAKADASWLVWMWHRKGWVMAKPVAVTIEHGSLRGLLGYLRDKIAGRVQREGTLRLEKK